MLKLMLRKSQCAVAEVGEILACRFAPAHLGHGQQARVHHIFILFVRVDVFGPLVGLHAVDQSGFFGRHVGLDGVVRIGLLQGYIAADGFGLADGRVLVVVQVEELGGRHHGAVSAAHGFKAAFLAPPGHYRGVGRQSALHDFVPTQ